MFPMKKDPQPEKPCPLVETYHRYLNDELSEEDRAMFEKLFENALRYYKQKMVN